MWVVNGYEIRMTEEDWGIELPFTFNGATLTASDAFRIVIKTAKNGDIILDRTYTNIQNNKFNFVVLESDNMPVGNHVYNLDWYQDGAFLCNLIDGAIFRVVDKA